MLARVYEVCLDFLLRFSTNVSCRYRAVRHRVDPPCLNWRIQKELGTHLQAETLDILDISPEVYAFEELDDTGL